MEWCFLPKSNKIYCQHMNLSMELTQVFFVIISHFVFLDFSSCYWPMKLNLIPPNASDCKLCLSPHMQSYASEPSLFVNSLCLQTWFIAVCFSWSRDGIRFFNQPHSYLQLCKWLFPKAWLEGKQVRKIGILFSDIKEIHTSGVSNREFV